MTSLKGPNPATGARGGDRVAIVLERTRRYSEDSVYYEYTLMDAGTTCGLF